MAGNRVISAVLRLRDQDFSSGMTDAARRARDLQRRISSAGNTTRKFGKAATSSFASVAKSAVGLAAAYVGVNAIKDLGVSMIQTAASAQAMNSQFEQVFTGMESAANTSLSRVADETGILSGRLKGTFLGMAAFAKTTGMDTAGALSLTERATLAAADGAAFYDKSIESVSESLQSFLKGNFANDAALGIAATETTRNAAANKLYGTSFKKLSEDQKQLTLLQMVEDGNKLSGALGQAARETDGLENVLGNLKESWRLVKEKFGEPLLGPVINSMKELTDRIGKVDTNAVLNKFRSFGDIAKNAFEKVKPVISFIKDTAIPGLKGEITALYGTSQPLLNWMKDVGFLAIGDAIVYVVEKATALYSYIKDNWSLIIPVVAGVAATMVTLKVGMMAITAATAIWKGVTMAAQIAMALFNGTLYLSPLGWVALAIGAVVAAGVLLYQNWDVVKAKATELWENLKLVWSGIQLGFSVAWNMVKSAAGSALNFIIEKVNGVIGLINKLPGVDIKAVGSVEWGKGSMPQYATGTSYAPGGLARINEGGRGEIVDLPNGSRVYPHDKSVQMARSEGKGVIIENINIQGTNLSIQQIAGELVAEVKLALGNM